MFLLIFGHHLAAGAAGRSGAFAQHPVVRPCNGQRVKGNARVVGTGPEHSGPFCTEAGRICHILLIGALDHHAVGQQQRGPHLEVGIRGISALLGLQDGLDQFLVLGAHFLGRGELLVGDVQLLFCHFYSLWFRKLRIKIGKS